MMSDKPDIEAIKARLAAYNKYRWYFCPRPEGHEGCLCDDCIAASNAHHEYNGHSQEDVAALLAEVERLQRERSEWCDRADQKLTEYMTQQRDLLAEVAALRARLTLTPEKVEAAAIAMWKFDDSPAAWDSAYEDERSDYLSLARAALLAAGMEEEQ